jgi:transposase
MSELSAEAINEIVHRRTLGQSVRRIARSMCLSRRAVSRALTEHDSTREHGAPHPELPRRRRRRQSVLDGYEAAIGEFIKRYPEITIIRLLEELRGLGYQGGYSILRERVKTLRAPVVTQPVQRFETGPGIQAQMDWAEYTIDFSAEGRRKVNLFSYLLGYCRRQYLRFTERQDFETLLREHIRAFEHLQGVAATCLYDNMKTVVDRWEGGEPLYNTRFLAFATHYGFRPRACWPRRPQTKGKVERPFSYVEVNLLNGRTFSSLEHLNQTTAVWLANTADVRIHREIGRRPIDAFVEEQPHLLKLPGAAYDTAKVVYRVVDVEGMISYENNLYSTPWRFIGRMLPVRVTEHELIVYDPASLEVVACHSLVPRPCKGERRIDDAHRPARDSQEQEEVLRERFGELGEPALRFLEGLLRTHRDGKSQARKVLSLLSLYHRDDVLTAIERAVRYHAFSRHSLERILAVQARPRPPLECWNDRYKPSLTDDTPVGPRPTADYQELLGDPDDDDRPPEAEG